MADQIRLNTAKILTVVFIGAAALFLFFRLGHYSLWDDEALVGLSAKGILRTGDTTALVDHNLVAYRNGTLLHDLHDRSTPPLPAYLTALSFAAFGQNTLSARVPFALCGLLWILLIVRWLWKAKVGLPALGLVFLGCLTNVSLFLFSRQCRYYALGILCSTAVVYLYLNWTGKKRSLIWISLLSVALFAANYIYFFALYGCLLLDYILWGRKIRALRFKDWLLLLVPQLMVGGLIFAIWNPFTTGNSAGILATTFSQRVWLIWISICDLNSCEFGVGMFVLLAPLVALLLRDLWLLRASCAWFGYVVLTSLLSPQIMGEGTAHADVRYLVPLISLSIFMGARMLILLSRKNVTLAFALAVVAFGSNLFEGMTLRPFEFRSSIINYLGELAHPPLDPYQPTAEWLRRNVQPRESVWVVPAEMTYPLMFHAPQPTYGWQLEPPVKKEFEKLDPIFFMGRQPPDYVVVFGPQMGVVEPALQKVSPETPYTRVALIDVYWRNTYRPEIYWRRFDQKTRFNRETEAVYILQRKHR